jgi:hypothetical protein|tara:strand:- start:57 stop:629 length:573 start_codon:yes stop_codon:yes gene_type:complete
MDKDEYIWKQRNEMLHKMVNKQMEEIKDLHKKSETIFDLARRFPNKTYRELEKYRDADREEEAQRVPLTESQKKQEELEPIEKGTCVVGKARKDREEANWLPTDITFKEKYGQERKRRQEAEGELSILRGIETNRVKEAQEALANALEVNESHQRLNGRLQVRITELEDDNKKMAKQIGDRVERARKAGL